MDVQISLANIMGQIAARTLGTFDTFTDTFEIFHCVDTRIHQLYWVFWQRSGKFCFSKCCFIQNQIQLFCKSGMHLVVCCFHFLMLLIVQCVQPSCVVKQVMLWFENTLSIQFAHVDSIFSPHSTIANRRLFQKETN